MIYKTDDGLVNIAELFGTTKQNVSLHLTNIFRESELNKESVVKDFLTTAGDNKKYKNIFCSLRNS